MEKMLASTDGVNLMNGHTSGESVSKLVRSHGFMKSSTLTQECLCIVVVKRLHKNMFTWLHGCCKTPSQEHVCMAAWLL